LPSRRKRREDLLDTGFGAGRAFPYARGLPRPLPLPSEGFANSSYAGKRLAKASTIIGGIVRKLPDQVGSRRWLVGFEHRVDL
jgi:hypothetical protein